MKGVPVMNREKAMRVIAAALLAALLPAAAVTAGEFGSRVMSGWFNVTTPDGWTGRRYMDGDDIVAEEFDSTGSGRIDVWRFYRRGLLSSEERDLGSDGKVNFQSRWDAQTGRLISVQRDTDWSGVNDLEIESSAPRRWEIREDRNQDGITDRILFISAPNDLFERLGIDLAAEQNIIERIPREYWQELWTDDGFTCAITEYRRYSRGRLTQYGEWDGRRIAWRRTGPDFEPSSPAVRLPAETAIAHGPNCPVPNCPEPMCRIEPSDAPITGDIWQDPAPVYAGPEYTGPYEGTAAIVENPIPFEQPYLGPGWVQERRPAVSDRTRYDGLPPGDSAARSVPARMRMPGQTGPAPASGRGRR